MVVLAVGALMLCGRFVAARGAVASSEPSSQPATAPTTALATAPTSAPTTGPITDASGWTVIFRSDDPIVWNANAGEPSDENGYALEMSALPEGTRYLRMKRMDSGESVIIQITRQQVIEGATLDGDVQWRPATPLRGGGQERSQLLGIVRRSWLANANNEHLIVYSRNWRGYRGWGFSKPVGTSMKQTYSWDGHPIDEPTVFEVAVKENDLDEEESGRLITDARRILAQNAPGTKIERQQASIYVMAVGFDPSGAVSGGAQELTLTAIPGAPRGNTAVAFVPASGEARRGTLDDAVWAVRLDHPRWEASKANLRLTPELHDATVAGAPLGAAAGVLLRSMLEGFEIDPGVAITGDVNPDGSLRPVTGIGGRLRAAPLAPSRCGTLILPSGSEPQLADALVFNGWGTLVKVQAIAADSLDDAVAVARRDRSPQWTEAIELFAQVQATLERPELIRTRAVRDKLERIVELAPNHLSAKLLSLVAQDKQPRRLSREATMYYIAVALHPLMPALETPAEAANETRVAPTEVKESQKLLDRLRRIGDLPLQPLVETSLGFARDVALAQRGSASLRAMQAGSKRLADAEEKVEVNRASMQAMLRDGM